MSTTRGSRMADPVRLTKFSREDLAAIEASCLWTWRAGLANRQIAPVTVCALGDSEVEGQGATSWARTWRAQLATMLRTRYQPAGIAGGRGFIGATKTGVTTFSWPTTLGGAPTIDTAYGPKRQSVILDAAGKSVTFTLQGTSCDLMVAAGSGSGIVSYTVDGGGASTYDCSTGNSGATPQGGKLKRITLGASGAHTLVVTYSSGGSCYIEGVIEYDGDETSGLRVHDCGHYGWTTQQWANRTGFNYWMASIRTLNPSLVILPLGTNDPFTGSAYSDPIQALTELRTIVSTMRGTFTVPPSILAVAQWTRSDIAAGFNWDGYVNSVRNLAATDALGQMGFLDLSKRMPSVAQSAALGLGLYVDTVHASDKGQLMAADAIYNKIAA